MTLTLLETVTWGTVTAAVLTALLLAAGETGMSDMKRLRGSPAAAAALLPAGPALAYVQRVSAMPGVPTVVVGSAAEQRDIVRR